MGFAAAVGAAGCRSGPQAGALALQSAILERHAVSGIYSLGIFNCRRITGTTSWSLHAEGRALDLGVLGAEDHAVASVLQALRSCGDQVLQRIMFDGLVYDLESPAGRPLTGGNPHTDHIHVELSWAAALGEIPLELALDEGEDAMPSDDELKSLVRAVLNEGTGHGQQTWASTSAALLSAAQRNYNLLVRIQGSLDQLVATLKSN